MQGAAFTATRHRELEAACEELVGAVFEDDPEAFAARWDAIDRTLREHMAAEEASLFPAHERIAPDDVKQLRTEHAQIREMLDEIGAHVSRHGIHAERLRRLVALLKVHVAREDATLYRWPQGDVVA
jgi:hemerythrin superfamily protein